MADHSDDDLSLECYSSDFNVSEPDELFHGEIQPYQFEPDAPACDDTEDEDQGMEVSGDLSEHRTADDKNWCDCGECIIMPTNQECVCCKKVERVEELSSQIPCITQHPGFESVCLNRYVLDVAYLQYKQQYGEREEHGNELYRYTAYRQFVRWCWHYLGKHVRVVLPSCVVSTIRSTFPSQEYAGYKNHE